MAWAKVYRLTADSQRGEGRAKEGRRENTLGQHRFSCFLRWPDPFLTSKLFTKNWLFKTQVAMKSDPLSARASMNPHHYAGGRYAPDVHSRQVLAVGEAQGKSLIVNY